MTPKGDTSASLSFVVPEPVDDNRVVAVVPEDGSLGVRLVDLTDVDRQMLGGFSVVQLERRKDGKFKGLNRRALISAMGSVDEMSPEKNVVK